MEYTKYDMYKQAEQRGGGWKQTAPYAGPAEAEVPDLSIKATEMVPELPEMDILDLSGEMAHVCPEPPEMGEESCGYCITPAMSYVPMTKWGEPREAEDGFSRGTIFPELDLPFVGEGAVTNG